MTPSPIVLEKLPLSHDEHALHDRAVVCAAKYREAEAALLDVIQKVDGLKLHRKFGLPSTFAYCTQQLRLSEATAYNFINVARKSLDVPELKAAIDDGPLSVSKARKIVPVLTEENQTSWIDRACALPQNKLEREVANANPGVPTMVERAKPTFGDRVRLGLSISEPTMRMLRKAQDICSEKRRELSSLEKTIEFVLEDFLRRHDPLARAERKAVRGKNGSASVQQTGQTCRATSSIGRRRQSISATTIHAVNLRDGRRCQAVLTSGVKCGATFWLHYHHIVPVASGGANEVENLVTLCSACHREWHRRRESAGTSDSLDQTSALRK